MQKGSRIVVGQVLLIMIVLGTLAGLFAASKRASLEARNKGVEIGLEFDEVARLSQVAQTPLRNVLLKFREEGVTSLIFNEDLLATLEQTGQAHTTRISPSHDFAPSYTFVNLESVQTLQRVRDALTARGIQIVPVASNSHPKGVTVFDASDGLLITPSTAKTIMEPAGESPTIITTVDGAISSKQAFAVDYEYVNLRNLGLGLSPENVQKARDAGLEIVGRVGNFPGVTPVSARNVLMRLKNAGVKLVIFNGDEALGYRGLEKIVAAMLRDPDAPASKTKNPSSPSGEGNTDKSAEKAEEMNPALELPTGLVFGEVEFSKQKGDDLLAGALHGDFVRVHSIQAAELGQLDEPEVIDRFALAARERNIRFCYVRLLTTAGRGLSTDNPLQNNLDFLHKIARGITRGPALLGGDYKLKFATRYGDTGSSLLMKALFALMALGVAAGTVWMLCELCPLPVRMQRLALICLSIACVGLVVGGGETGRKIVALLAGIAFPIVACLLVYPGREKTANFTQNSVACLRHAIRAIGYASAITALGIVHVVGLLASRAFMLRANQFLGIKLQHAAPLLIIAFVALIGGLPKTGELWSRFKLRVRDQLQHIYDEPARFGLLLVGLIALGALYIIVARTGNDSAVGASGIEMKLRSILDRVLPVRPRTKEFLVGHPAFILALAWWWRGRRQLAIPAFIVGCIGQVSLLNTFCHIHTPLISSVWRDGIGLVFGIVLGIVVFLIGERLLPPPRRPEDT